MPVSKQLGGNNYSVLPLNVEEVRIPLHDIGEQRKLAVVAPAGPEVQVIEPLLGLVWQLGMDSFTYGCCSFRKVGEPVVYVYTTLSNWWMAHYHTAGYFDHDPRIAHCHYRTTPMSWSINEMGSGPAQMVAEMTSEGLCAGAAFPVHDDDGQVARIAMLAMNSSDKDFWDKAGATGQQSILAEGSRLASYLHNEIKKSGLLDARRLLKQPLLQLLSPREKRILELVAVGYESIKIALTLDLAERTVNFHVGNILAKLGVPTRAAAVALAVRQGII